MRSPKTAADLEDVIRYQFTDRSLLEEAFRHSSYVNEQSDRKIHSNERLEFLGDAVLNLAIGHLLMARHPGDNEGTLSKMRAGLVNESQLSQISRDIHLGEHLFLGRGEIMSDGRNKQSILADALEALIGAVYMDGGYTAAFRVVEGLFHRALTTADAANSHIDYKSRLQELVQIFPIAMPDYVIVNEIGPDHDKTFTVELAFDVLTARGTGKSKKTAEQEAAKNAYTALEKRLKTA